MSVQIRRLILLVRLRQRQQMSVVRLQKKTFLYLFPLVYDYIEIWTASKTHEWQSLFIKDEGGGWKGRRMFKNKMEIFWTSNFPFNEREVGGFYSLHLGV